MKKRGEEINAKLLEIFKGIQDDFKKDFLGNIKFNVYVGWSYACFEKGEKALLLLDKVSNGSLIVPTSNHKFKFAIKDGIEIVIAQQTTKSFWHNINFTKFEDNSLTTIPWNQLKIWLQNNL